MFVSRCRKGVIFAPSPRPSQLVETPGNEITSVMLNRHNLPTMLRLMLSNLADWLAHKPLIYSLRMCS